MRVDVIKRSKESIDKTALIKWINKIEIELLASRKNCGKVKKLIKRNTLNIVFVSVSRISRLNKQFRNSDDSTDILSFSALDGVDENDFLGELVICLPVLYQNKPIYLSRIQWLYYLVLHGLLHLLGFHHDNKRSAKQMYDLQNSVFDKLCALYRIS